VVVKNSILFLLKNPRFFLMLN